MGWYFDVVDAGLEPVVPYVFRVQKGKASSPVAFN